MQTQTRERLALRSVETGFSNRSANWHVYAETDGSFSAELWTDYYRRGEHDYDVERFSFATAAEALARAGVEQIAVAA